MTNFVNSFYGQGNGVKSAMDRSTEKADKWLISLDHDFDEVNIVQMSVQCFPSGSEYDIYIITLAVKCKEGIS